MYLNILCARHSYNMTEDKMKLGKGYIPAQCTPEKGEEPHIWHCWVHICLWTHTPRTIDDFRGHIFPSGGRWCRARHRSVWQSVNILNFSEYSLTDSTKNFSVSGRNSDFMFICGFFCWCPNLQRTNCSDLKQHDGTKGPGEGWRFVFLLFLFLLLFVQCLVLCLSRFRLCFHRLDFSQYCSIMVFALFCSAFLIECSARYYRMEPTPRMLAFNSTAVNARHNTTISRLLSVRFRATKRKSEIFQFFFCFGFFYQIFYFIIPFIAMILLDFLWNTFRCNHSWMPAFHWNQNIVQISKFNLKICSLFRFGWNACIQPPEHGLVSNWFFV